MGLELAFFNNIKIPCNHGFYDTITPYPESANKILQIHFVTHRTNATTMIVNPWCPRCEQLIDIMVGSARCRHYRTAMKRDLEQQVEDKIMEVANDGQGAYGLDYVLEGRDFEHECEWNSSNEAMDSVVRASFEESLAAVRTIPASEEAIEALERTITPSEKNSTCVICLDQLVGRKKNEVRIRRMPCKHEFHEGCILQWLHTNHFCPLCRFELPMARSN